MDGKDLQRRVGARLTGRATRESLEVLRRRQGDTPPGHAGEIDRVARLDGAATAEERLALKLDGVRHPAG
jgi:hypothetical protein